jgi:multidrug efflux pump subunit AcrA (membrane-fusion protein)
MRGHLWSAAALLVIAAVGVSTWFTVARLPDQNQPVDTTLAKPTPAQPVVSEPRRTGSLIASGYVVARRKATVAAEITGKIVETLVEEGMVIQAGQVIARLDSVLAAKDLALARSRAESAEAAVAAMEADLAEAERVFNRTHSLALRNVSSQADLTKAEARVAVLRAQLRQSEAQRATAHLDAQRAAAVLDKHEIRAPFTGIVIERSAQPGEVISPMSAGGFRSKSMSTRRSSGVSVQAPRWAPCSTPIPIGPSQARSSPSSRRPIARRRPSEFALGCRRRTRASFRTWRSR